MGFIPRFVLLVLQQSVAYPVAALMLLPGYRTLINMWWRITASGYHFVSNASLALLYSRASYDKGPPRIHYR